jgi:hydrogenase maturation protein HypF
MKLNAIELTVFGMVQGVGFRPYVYRLALRYGLAGMVGNTSEGVLIRAQGSRSTLRAFIKALKDEVPRLASITSIKQRHIEARPGKKGFLILASQAGLGRKVLISPDVAVCKKCVRELFDPEDRRYGYPFINCTDCGPRFTVIEAMPYDRPSTSMKLFPMCKECAKEYHDPPDRRFHAQPNACWTCGPSLFWHGSNGGGLVPSDDPVSDAAKALRQGHIVAIKGLGGFHLAVNAGSEKSVALLRARKGRRSKPLAVMVRDINAARRLCRVSSEEAGLLVSLEGPIVLLKKNENADLASNLSPRISDLGLMLPYTPLHHLLLAQGDCPEALVMTSGNPCNSPICTGNDEALHRLSGIADYFLLHDREIVARADDSVLKVAAGKVRMIRRSRGYVPRPVRMPWKLPQILACGGDLKNTFCLAEGRKAFLSQHIGDLGVPDTLDFFRKGLEHLKEVLGIVPETVVCDLHPDYFSTRQARGLPLPCTAVQHHHAHAVSVMAEHGLDGTVLAVIMDGAGYGPDGTVWGGELLLASRSGYRRMGRLGHLPLPGGDAAAKAPWRMGLSILWATFGPDGLTNSVLPVMLCSIPEEKRRVVAQMMAKGLNSPATSSCGRLFDGVAALLGLRSGSEYEGQAAMELESLAWEGSEEMSLKGPGYPLKIRKKKGLWVIDLHGLTEAIIDDLVDKVPKRTIALRFHVWLARSIVLLLKRLSDETDIKTVVLAGGCMQNALLLQVLVDLLGCEGFFVYAGEQIPANDGGLSLGQVVIGGNGNVPGHSHARH